MHLLSVLTTLLPPCTALFTTPQQKPLHAQQQKQPALRNATIADADAIADVLIAAFSPTPPWKYIYQFHETHPKEHHRCVRHGILQGFSRGSYYAHVIEAPAESNLTIAAVAIWHRNASTQQDGMFLHGLSKQCEHRDLNITRALDMERRSVAATRKYVDEPFGADQLYLNTLCTHPDYQRRGAGTRLVREGLDVGRRDGVNVTLIALPSSESFYVRLGFESVVNFTIESLDAGKGFRYNVMAYNFTSEE